MSLSMLAQIRNLPSFRTAKLVLLAATVSTFSSCATKKQEPLIGSATQAESSLPWNKQEKWESQGQFGPLAERNERR